MMKRRKVFSLLLGVLILAMLFPVTASADSGPKPSVHIAVEGLKGETCYATLLSSHSSTGPSHAYHGDIDDGERDPIWRAFAAYRDSDGFYYLQEHWDITESEEMAWTYHPPYTFKVLLYFPEQNRFVCSGIYERYAFDAYYTLNLEEAELLGQEALPLRKSYDYSWELISLAARIVITVLLELAMALFFGLARRRELIFIAAVNLFTQISLNVALNLVNFRSGQSAFLGMYFYLELWVLVIEAVLYCMLMGKFTRRTYEHSTCWRYATAANVVSYVSGLLLSIVIPGIF